MELVGRFFRFAERVLTAVRASHLPKSDIKKLERLLTRTGKRNVILAKGILSALSAGGATEKDINKFSELLGRANKRIVEDKEPFTASEKSELMEIFKRSYVSAKAAHWFASQIDELISEEIEDFVKGTRMVIPSKRTGFEEKNERKKIRI